MKRRDFLRSASLFGAALAFNLGEAHASARAWRERRDLYPEGVASGDPHPDSVLLWTRRPPVNGDATARLTVEVAEDEKFHRVIATTSANLTAASDWTCRVLAAGLKPGRVYWYRFTDENGNGSRVGRTITAPADKDSRPVRFAFVSCQDANTGAQNAYRRMIYEDERAPENDRLGFVLHLGDFIYEMVWYPEDRPQGYYDRKIFDIVRYPTGEKISDFHVPVTLEDYRAVYCAYLHDPEIQDARARWPFICIWDNHEYSWLGYQGLQVFGGKTRPAQTRKVAANQAWWEFQPARVKKPSGPSLETFDPPHVVDAPITQFDAHGLGQEENNLAAIASLKAYRTAKWGANVDLFITDLHSYRSPEPDVPEGDQFFDKQFPYFVPEEVIEILDAGATYDGGHPPTTIRYAGKDINNSRRDGAAPSLLGAEQKAWFLSQLKASRAPWKIWGNSLGTLSGRSDPQNLPAGSPPWGGGGYASLGGSDWSTWPAERGEIYDAVRDAGITGFAIVAGDRHAFWAGLPSKSLPPKPFEPVGIEFVVGAISSPGTIEAAEFRIKKGGVPLSGMYIAERPGAAGPEPTINMLVRHGVRSALEYADSGDIEKARALSNPDLSPHLSFVDLGAQGYATVRVTPDALETEFVCVERPIDRATSPDGGPLAYRVRHRARLWKPGEHPKLEQQVLEGDPKLSI